MSRRGAILQDYGGSFPEQSTQAQRDAANYYQRDKEQANQMAFQKERDKAQAGEQAKKDAEADKYRKLKMIDDATDTKPYQNSTQKANSLGTQQLLAIREKYAGKTDLPADQLYLQLQQDLTPVAQGYNTYKDNLKSMEEMAKEAVKVNPNLDLEKVLVDLQKDVDSEYLTANPDGTTNFNQARIGTQSDALARILKPENAWKYSKGNKPLIDAVTGKGQDGELFAIASDGSQINYKAKIPKWAEIVDEKGNPLTPDANGIIPRGKVPRLALKGTKQDYEEIDEKGNKVVKTMVVVPKSTMKDILSNDETEYAFEGDWQKHKQLSNIQPSPSEEQDLKQIYFSQWLADNGLAQPTVSARTNLPKQPPAPRITVNVGKGEQGGGVVGNVLNTLEVSPDQKDGTYAMVKGREGNKKNLADIQILLGEEVMPASEINDNDPQYKINYEVKDGQIESITYKGTRYDRDFFQRRQEVYDKNPKWAGKLLYPTQQRGSKQGEQNRSNTKPTAGKIPIGTVLTGKDGKKIKTTREITQAEAAAAGYK